MTSQVKPLHIIIILNNAERGHKVKTIKKRLSEQKKVFKDPRIRMQHIRKKLERCDVAPILQHEEKAI